MTLQKGAMTLVILQLDDEIIKSLSNNELAVLQYVYDNIHAVADMSIQELAKNVSYSTSTILRFCKKLGFSGYAEFKYSLRSEIQKKNLPDEVPRHALTDKIILDTICSDIEATSNLISEDLLDITFRYLDSDFPIYLWSPGGLTTILIDYLEKLLFAIGRQNVYKIEASKTANHIIRRLDKHNILFVISTTGDFSPTVKLAKTAAMNHIPIISITPYTNNTIASIASVNFRFFTNQRENNGAEYTSRLPIFYTIQIIIKSYLKYKKKRGLL